MEDMSFLGVKKKKPRVPPDISTGGMADPPKASPNNNRDDQRNSLPSKDPWDVVLNLEHHEVSSAVGGNEVVIQTKRPNDGSMVVQSIIKESTRLYCTRPSDESVTLLFSHCVCLLCLTFDATPDSVHRSIRQLQLAASDRERWWGTINSPKMLASS